MDNTIEKMMNEVDNGIPPRRPLPEGVGEVERLRMEQRDNCRYVYEPDWRPQHRARAIVRLERLERAYARHEEILGRINALLDAAARKAD